MDALGWIAVADSELAPTVPEYRASRSAGNELEEDDDDGMEERILASSVASIESATACILTGTRIAHAASILLRSQLLTHRALGLKYAPDHLPSLISLMEVLKSR